MAIEPEALLVECIPVLRWRNVLRRLGFPVAPDARSLSPAVGPWLSLEYTSAYLSVTRADAFARARGVGALGDQRRRV